MHNKVFNRNKKTKSMFYKSLITFSFLAIVNIAYAQPASGRIDTVMTPDQENSKMIECRIRHIDGKTKSIGYLLNGKREGMWRSYNPQGMPMSYEEYKADVRHGFTVNFANNATVENEQTYKDGKLHGTKFSYLYGSIVKTKETYRNGLLDGEKVLNYEDGTPQEISNYKNGQRHGKAIWYLQGNKPSIEYTYDNGVLSGPAKLYSDGVLTHEGVFKNDNEEGEWKVYEDGVLLKTVLYKEGVVIKETAAKK